MGKALFRAALGLVAGAMLFSSAAAFGQNWPERPVRILIGYTPGGTVDGWSRLIARRLEERFKQPFIVENRPGANATLATAAIAAGPTDGYLFSFIAMTTQGRNFQKNVTYDTMKDFEPIAGLYSAPFAFAVGAGTPFRSVKDVVDYAKANPGKLNFGTGVTTFMLIATVMKQSYGFEAVLVPYKGQAPTLTALVAGEVQLIVDQLAVMKPHADAGKIRVLAVTGEQRAPIFPDVPTFSEIGQPGLTFNGNSMFWARRGFLKEASDKINAAMPEIFKSPEIVERLRLEAAQPLTGTQQQLWDRYVKEAEFMAAAAKAAKYEPQ